MGNGLYEILASLQAVGACLRGQFFRLVEADYDLLLLLIVRESCIVSQLITKLVLGRERVIVCDYSLLILKLDLFLREETLGVLAVGGNLFSDELALSVEFGPCRC